MGPVDRQYQYSNFLGIDRYKAFTDIFFAKTRYTETVFPILFFYGKPVYYKLYTDSI